MVHLPSCEQSFFKDISFLYKFYFGEFNICMTKCKKEYTKNYFYIDIS